MNGSDRSDSLKYIPPFESDGLSELRLQCETLHDLYWSLWNALNIVSFRECGADFFEDVYRETIKGEQGERYLAGLQKLGIENDPPAIKAAKYHYFSNILGGLAMEIVIESERKAWIRYVGPQTTWPGLALLAFPPIIRRRSYQWWHPMNGPLMGCPRLQWVLTKLRAEGDPYDEGYFVELDHDLGPHEIGINQVVRWSPEFDAAAAPQLDANEWPEARRLKARRNYARDYAQRSFEAIEHRLGERDADEILRKALVGMAVQDVNGLAARLQLEVGNAAEAARLVSGVLWLLQLSHDVSWREGNTVVVHLTGEGDTSVLAPHRPAVQAWLSSLVVVLSRRVNVTFAADNPQRIACLLRDERSRSL